MTRLKQREGKALVKLWFRGGDVQHLGRTVVSSPRTNGPKTGTGTEWQSNFTTTYTRSERYGGRPLVDRGRYTVQEAPSDRGGTHPYEER